MRFTDSDFRIVPAPAELVNINCLVIEDIGHRNGRRTVTNDADRVVQILTNSRTLPSGRRLFYYDSEGELGELIHDNAGGFVDFGPGPAEPTDEEQARS